MPRTSQSNDLLKEDGSLTKNDNEKAEVLNSFFKSVFTVEDTSQLPEPQGMKVDQVLSTVEITSLIVKNKLLKLNKSKSTGPDLIHPWVLSETAGSICIPLAMNAYDLHKVYGTRYHAFKLETGSCECNL